jgi:transposase InsO family protein
VPRFGENGKSIKKRFASARAEAAQRSWSATWGPQRDDPEGDCAEEESACRWDEAIDQCLKEQYHARLPKATLYRHLKRAGPTRLKLGVAKRKVRCRWTRDQSYGLCIGDFEDGSHVMSEDRAVAPHLSAFIDCHSRYAVETRYYLRENLDILIDSLLRAWSVHGASRKLYLDNGEKSTTRTPCGGPAWR